MYQKKKWRYQIHQRNNGECKSKRIKPMPVVRTLGANTIGSFLHRAQRALISCPWQVIQIISTTTPGEYKLWTLVNMSSQLLFFFTNVSQINRHSK